MLVIENTGQRGSCDGFDDFSGYGGFGCDGYPLKLNQGKEGQGALLKQYSARFRRALGFVCRPFFIAILDKGGGSKGRSGQKFSIQVPNVNTSSQVCQQHLSQACFSVAPAPAFQNGTSLCFDL